MGDVIRLDDGAALFDITDAVLLDNVTAGRISDEAWPGDAAALLLEGRVNNTDERVKVLFVFRPEVAAQVAAELLDVSGP